MNRENIKIVLIVLVILIITVVIYIISWQSSLSDADRYWEKGDYKAAEEKILENLGKYPDFLPKRQRDFVRLGEIYHNKGDKINAEKYYLLSLSYDQNIALSNYRVGVYRDEKGRYLEAIDHYKKAKSIPGLDEVKLSDLNIRLSETAYILGRQYQISGDQEKAEKLYNISLNADSDFPEALHAKGQLLLDQRRYKEAWELYEKALKLNPELTILYNNAAKLLQRMGNSKLADYYSAKYKKLRESQQIIYDNQTLIESGKGTK